MEERRDFSDTELPMLLRKWRNKFDRTQAWVAEKVGVSTSTYTRWEKGNRPMAVGYLFLIADAYGISAYDLTRDPDVPSVDAILRDGRQERFPDFVAMASALEKTGDPS